ncbi:universal stress protein [Streptomyces formicae]|uniref:Universal stress protein n=1 Tax=Streptomyces formicae TaxID=1616117 RepID=A0ABY3WSX6_9ACTN|nr:universal stress protein [Streptomyces formicae]UNM13670.1 universal stress protein [Streptomyces formicae]
MAIPLVAGFDGSEASLEAVDWAAEEAVRHDVPLHLVYAVAPDHDAVAPDHDAVGPVAAAMARARKGAPSVRLSSEVLHEDPASALLGKGRNAFALVLGCRGLGDLNGLLLGSVSLAVAARADCPVIVVRGEAEHRDGRFGSVVVGVEDGEGSRTAVQFAFREAHVRHCGLVAVHAWSVPFGAFSEPPPPSGYALEAHCRPPAQVLDDALRGPAERYPDGSVSREVVEGSARQALLAAASYADLLVVGSGTRRGHLGLQLGLVNHAVLHHAPRPVAVVPQM